MEIPYVQFYSTLLPWFCLCILLYIFTSPRQNVWFSCIWRKLESFFLCLLSLTTYKPKIEIKNIGGEKPVLIRQADWGIYTMILRHLFAGKQKGSQNLPVQVIIFQIEVTGVLFVYRKINTGSSYLPVNNDLNDFL